MSWQNCRKIFYVIGVMCFAWVVNLPALSVQAQDLTEVRIRPEVSVVTEGEAVQITVDVVRGEDLSGYDLTLTYDPDIVNLVSWAHGSYLKNLAVIKTDLQSGRIRLAAVQVGSPGVSGDGNLLVLTFNAKHAGESAVVVESIELATSASTRVDPAIADGLIIVNSPVTETPVPTKTATYTKTATITLTRTPTRTFTATRISTTTGVTITPTRVENDNINALTATPRLGTAQVTATPLPVQSTIGKTYQPSSTSSLPFLAQTGDVVLTNPSTSTDQEALSTASLDENRGLRDLNRLLWGFAILLLVVLVCFVVILVLENRQKNDKG